MPIGNKHRDSHTSRTISGGLIKDTQGALRSAYTRLLKCPPCRDRKSSPAIQRTAPLAEEGFPLGLVEIGEEIRSDADGAKRVLADGGA